MISNNDEVYEIAPRENQPTKLVIFDDHCKEMTFQQLFSSGKFGFKVKRNIQLTASKYFN